MTARISSITIYSQIARESFDKMVALEPKRRAIENKLEIVEDEDGRISFEFDLRNVEFELAKLASITIVFTAISIEAHIYDYAARNFSDSFVKKYIDKLDTTSKWVIIPKLITGKDLPRGGEWFQLLKNLIRERNSIIHSKSSETPRTSKELQEYFEKRKEDNANTFMKAKEAIRLLDLLPTEIEKIDAEELYWATINLSKPSNTLEEI